MLCLSANELQQNSNASSNKRRIYSIATHMSKAKPMDDGAYKDAGIEAFIESSHTEQMLQMYQTVLQHFDLGTCL